MRFVCIVGLFMLTDIASMATVSLAIVRGSGKVPDICLISTKLGMYRHNLRNSQHQISHKSVLWELRWHVRTDGKLGRRKKRTKVRIFRRASYSW